MSFLLRGTYNFSFCVVYWIIFISESPNEIKEITEWSFLLLFIDKDLKTNGFEKEACRSMINLLDVSFHFSSLKHAFVHIPLNISHCRSSTVVQKKSNTCLDNGLGRQLAKEGWA